MTRKTVNIRVTAKFHRWAKMEAAKNSVPMIKMLNSFSTEKTIKKTEKVEKERGKKSFYFRI